MNTTDKRPTKE